MKENGNNELEKSNELWEKKIRYTFEKIEL